MATGCAGECGLQWLGGGEVELLLEGDDGRVTWTVPGARKPALDQGWIAAQAEEVVPLEGAWLVYGTDRARRNDPREVLLSVSAVLPGGADCGAEHRVFLEALLSHDKDAAPQLIDMVFEVTATSGGSLIATDAALQTTDLTADDAPYATGKMTVPSMRWDIDADCTAPSRGSLSIHWALDPGVVSGGTRTCSPAPLPVDALRAAR